MKTLLFKMRHYLTEENRFGHRSWAELPSNILTTAAYLEKKHFDVEVRDDAFYPDAIFENFDTVVCWASIADGLYEALDYLRVAKNQKLNCILVLFDDWEGLSAEILRDYPHVDFAIRRWDVEETLAQLLAFLDHTWAKAPMPAKGIVYKENGKIIDTGEAVYFGKDLTHLGSARKWIEKFDLSVYSKFSVRACAGCPFKCTFCHIGHRPNRYRQAEDVVDELAALPRGAEVRLLSADFLQNAEWVANFAKHVIAAGIDVRWDTDTRFTWLKDLELLKLIREAGCVELAIGLESYHPDMLKAYKKGYSHDLIQTGIENMITAGIKPALNMMIGHPREPVAALEHTEDFLGQMDPAQVKLLGIQYLRPLPGTEIAREAEDLGLWKVHDGYKRFVHCRDYPSIRTLHLDPEEIVTWRDRLTNAYFASPTVA